MTQFLASQLIDKDSQDIKEIESLAFEYMLAGIAKEYTLGKGFSWVDLNDFNEKNQLNLSTVLSYPFFIALANGHSRSLFNLFGIFKSSAIGPASLSLFELINNNHQNNTLRYFEIGSENNRTGTFVKDARKFKTFDEIQEAIKNDVITLQSGISEKFSEIKIQSDIPEPKQTITFNPLYSALNTGICILKNEPTGNFFTADRKSIIGRAFTFKDFENAYNNNRSDIIRYQNPHFTTKNSLSLSPGTIVE